MEVSENEVLHYLGYHGSAAEERVSALIRQLTTELEACLNPKNLFEIFDCRVDFPVVVLGDMTINSANLAEHLKDCRRATLLAATLGTGADTLIRR